MSSQTTRDSSRIERPTVCYRNKRKASSSSHSLRPRAKESASHGNPFAIFYYVNGSIRDLLRVHLSGSNSCLTRLLAQLLAQLVVRSGNAPLLLVSFPGLERAVQRGFGDLEGTANLRNGVLLIAVECLGNIELFSGEGFGSPTSSPHLLQGSGEPLVLGFITAARGI
jgi:hypothetical protein